VGGTWRGTSIDHKRSAPRKRKSHSANHTLRLSVCPFPPPNTLWELVEGEKNVGETELARRKLNDRGLGLALLLASPTRLLRRRKITPSRFSGGISTTRPAPLHPVPVVSHDPPTEHVVPL
jgi:hypothetical protein